MSTFDRAIIRPVVQASATRTAPWPSEASPPRSTNTSPSYPPQTVTQSAPFNIRNSTVMSNMHAANSASSAGWTTFAYASFAMAVFMSGLGIYALDHNIWVKGYMMMAMVFLTGSTFTLAKTVRDEHEARRFANRIEEAKTEKLLMEINRS